MNDMMDDIKKYQKAEKLKKMREEVQEVPVYFDGLENLCDRIHPGKQTLRVTDIVDLSYDTKLYRLISAKPRKPLAPFRAGQYIGLAVEINGVRTLRPYSIVSSPNQLGYYELGVRKKEGGFVSPYLFNEVKVGDIFETTEPLGELYYNPLFHGNNLVFIAGGCGVTPFMSMLRYFSELALPHKITLIFGCVTEKDVLFREELEDIARRRTNITVNFILSEAGPEWTGECGFITSDKISKFVESVDKKYFYIVGSREMYNFIEPELKNLGVKQHRMFFEAYGVPDDVTKIIGWPDNITSTETVNLTINFYRAGQKVQERFEVPCTEPLLNSIERNLGLEHDIDSGCRSGQCALCRTRIVEGKVFVPPDVTIREMDKDFGFIHPCVSYPLTDVYLDLTQT